MNQIEFVQLTERFKDRIFRLAKRLLISTEEAEDATQEILLKLWSKKESLAAYKSVEALAMTMIKNHCLDQLKAKRSLNMRIESQDFKDSQTMLDKKLEDLDHLQWVEKCINQLPEQQRIIVHLRDIEEYEFEEIAKILEISESTIRVALSRARKAIREKIIKINEYGIK
ncbi:RNA polymerase sigma-70 factor, ECF subfamily [Flavobacterium segetis]|uniref:RNA polymerase sigma-70 factor, ECF subfamily n=1 Tax=Flavobacterium segetis TaxID=271157 RepID=A0A1M5EDP3_9FLAO|nr:RNA polymerase sigma factor [Flavobacterium segetis]SHF77359.1 RNA polymerase sigma-70 factor, ECF subfamily [Flavobacterium segetis]